MANWAIVIGINQYWEPSRCLKGAVNDATRVVNWLLNSPECRVPPENMFLLTRPRPEPALIPNGVQYSDAIADNLLQAIPALDQQSGRQGGERFFFYFSGHGITNYENFRDEQALLMADFTPILTNKAVKLNSIKDYFKATPFQEQFFFVDACRNLLPWDYDFETGATTVKKQIDIKQPPVDQFILNSTAPRSLAWEGLLSPNDAPGDERGAFTSALLDGLGGAGSAKVYSSNDDEYLVQKELLFTYVINKIEERKIFVIKSTTHPVIQRPRKDGESAKNPVLARIPLQAVKPEPLELYVEPDDVWPQAELKVTDENHEFEQTFDPPVTGVPLLLPPLRPMNYTVHAAAPNYILEGKNGKRRSFPLYEPTKISVRLIPLQVEVSPADDSPPPADSGFGPAAVSFGINEKVMPQPCMTMPNRVVAPESFGIDENVGEAAAMPETDKEQSGTALASSDTRSIGGVSFGHNTRGAPIDEPRAEVPSRVQTLAAARLIVESSDPLAPLEIANRTGTLLKAGQGQLELDDLEAGFYILRLVLPEGENVEETVELLAGETETVRLDAPAPRQTRLLQEVIAKANFLVQEDNTLNVSETVGPIASAQLSTILTLAAQVSNQDQTWGKRLSSLGLTPFQKAVSGDAVSGVQIISGIEFTEGQEALAYLSEARLYVWPQGEAIPESPSKPTALASVEGIAEFAQAAPPGPHWLALELPNQPPVAFALNMLEQRLTMLIFHRDIEGYTRIFQYLPSLQADSSSGLQAIRRLELMQRFALSGRFNNAYQLAKAQLDGQAAGPLTCCLRGYLALELHDIEGLALVTRTINELYPQLSDGYVLEAEYQTLMESGDKAEEAVRAAVAHGIPIFTSGLVRLYASLQRYGIDPAGVNLLTEAFTRRVRGLLWSAWTIDPAKFSPGKRLEE